MNQRRRWKPPRSTTRLCTSIAAEDPSRMRQKAERALSLGSDLVEFRLDKLKVVKAELVIRSLSKFADRCILTLRPTGEGGNFDGSESARMELLSRVCELAPAYADVELEAAKKFPARLEEVKENCGKVIISWHDLRSTPSTLKLQRLYREAKPMGDIVKLISMARSVEDNAIVLSLYRSLGLGPGSLIAFCMGDRGMLSRILCALAGSPITYASLPRQTVAPGQLTIKSMRGILGAVS